jgi:hypothetical protein
MPEFRVQIGVGAGLTTSSLSHCRVYGPPMRRLGGVRQHPSLQAWVDELDFSSVRQKLSTSRQTIIKCDGIIARLEQGFRSREAVDVIAPTSHLCAILDHFLVTMEAQVQGRTPCLVVGHHLPWRHWLQSRIRQHSATPKARPYGNLDRSP